MANLRYGDLRQATEYRLIPANKKICLELLDTCLKPSIEAKKADSGGTSPRSLNPRSKVKGTKQLIELFEKNQFPTKTSNVKKRFRSALAHYFPADGSDVPLDVETLVEYIGARQTLIPFQTDTNRLLLQRIAAMTHAHEYSAPPGNKPAL